MYSTCMYIHIVTCTIQNDTGRIKQAIRGRLTQVLDPAKQPSHCDLEQIGVGVLLAGVEALGVLAGQLCRRFHTYDTLYFWAFWVS